MHATGRSGASFGSRCAGHQKIERVRAERCCGCCLHPRQQGGRAWLRRLCQLLEGVLLIHRDARLDGALDVACAAMRGRRPDSVGDAASARGTRAQAQGRSRTQACGRAPSRMVLRS
eukprot:scaffold2751_cov344-Prasinococcus_capsulatus_cf.AAC.10